MLQGFVARPCDALWLQPCLLQKMHHCLVPRPKILPLLPNGSQVCGELGHHEQRDDATRSEGFEDELRERVWCGVDATDVRQTP